NDVKLTVRKDGVISKLIIYLLSNTITGTTSFTVRKNGADTGIVINVSTTGAQLVEDLINTVSVAAGDTIDLKTVPGAATGTFAINVMSLSFKADDGKSCQLLGVARSANLSVSSGNRYVPLGGDSTPDSTEAEAKCRQRKAGTYQYLYVVVTANARTTSTTLRTRKNGANGNISVTIGAGATGVFEDTSNVDTVAVDDDYNFQFVTGSGSETLRYSVIAISFFADDNSGCFVTGNLNTVTVAANTTTYFTPGGTTNASTEVSRQRRIRQTKIIVVGMSCYLVQNSVTANSTLTLRRNGANVNNAIILTASTTGFFSVTNQTDEFGWGDDMAIQLVTGATGTQIEISNIVIFYKLPRLNKIFRYVFNIKARTSKQFRYKFNIVARTSKIFRYPFNIKQRISKVFRYPYRITQRAQRKSLVFDGTDDRIDCGNQSDLWSKSKTKFSF